ncbi:D-2-hydroxyacid dehydrogenase [Helicobacter didelphidarum]|uniref:D-2-hydroxyacid dehydrogenase n=1 Tax=Helicobacter didelphidarum TaxID=2040648 RepID=A0A3D8I9M1_9HELI|nr:D-2-hydroxyacid dehydrogenase [Helicobacter didelphidarum]RDU61873.1 D-2-hydroxyacid dehydrogenase [Helicobacter didelphidarum]
MKIVMLDALTLGEFNATKFQNLGDFTSYPITNQDEILMRCKDAQIIITNKVILNAETLESLPNLQLICVAATGTNNIDLQAAKRHGIEVKNVAGYSTAAVAQHTLMLALAFLGQLPYYTSYVREGKWTQSNIFCHLGREIRDINQKEWGIIGFGTIGKQVCKLAQAFGTNVSYYSTSGSNTQCEIPHKSLDELLATSDIISIHAPFNEKTHNLIGLTQLKQLKKGAILLNLGRGGIVNEEELAKSLKEQDFYFGADVLEKEPMIPNHPLLDSSIADKILLTPHIAWAHKDTKERLLELVVKNIETFLEK